MARRVGNWGGAEGLHVWASDASQELLRVVWQPDMMEVRQELRCRHARKDADDELMHRRGSIYAQLADEVDTCVAVSYSAGRVVVKRRHEEDAHKRT